VRHTTSSRSSENGVPDYPDFVAFRRALQRARVTILCARSSNRRSSSATVRPAKNPARAMDNSPDVRTLDPPVPDWINLTLPDAWPDELFKSPLQAWRLLARISGKRRKVELPVDMPGRELLPKYILQEFHSLPNGNYSKRLTHGYITGFDRLMLGRMTRARAHIAHSLRDCRAVLDVGCGGGRTAGLLQQSGIPDVWGMDPSPYLLQHAARAFPTVNFVQGIAESTPFPNARFDGIAACFLLHEMPPTYIERALREFARILRPDGLLAICEPSAIQLQVSPWRLLRHDGVLGWYFRVLASLVHEPFVDAWHRRNAADMLAAAGFDIVSDEQAMPVRHILARRRACREVSRDR
jgi:ubiquinone/menaquinone biosynthesis C-methylase UbiE